VGQTRPFRFGVQHYPATSGEDWKEKARRAEALGYDTFVMPDHISQGGLAYAPALMAAADATTSLRIGTLVLNNDFRHPALVASEAATLDLLSDGRFELGIGAGWDPIDYEVPGIEFDAPRDRVNRFAESVQIIKQLLAGETVSFTGRYYTVRNLQNAPSSVQRPHPPLLIGAAGPRMLAIAAREAGLEVLGISLVTNLAAGISAEPPNHEEVLQAGREAAPRLRRLLAGIAAAL
jgi:probable F420-dependent oxidoreductase